MTQLTRASPEYLRGIDEPEAADEITRLRADNEALRKDAEGLIALFERYAAQRIMAHEYGNKHGDVDASEETWKQFRGILTGAMGEQHDK